MTDKQFYLELHYWVMVALSKELLAEGLLSAEDFDVINKMAADIYPSMVAILTP